MIYTWKGFILFVEHMNSPTDTALLSQTPDVAYPFHNELKSIIEDVQLARQIATENSEHHKQYNKAYHYKTAEDPEHKLGDLVWLFDPRVPVGLSRKWRPRWVGLYCICDLGPHNTYCLRHALTQRVAGTLGNAYRLKPATNQDESVIRQHQQRLNQQRLGRQERPSRGAELWVQNIEADEVRRDPEQTIVNRTQQTRQAEKVVNLVRERKERWFIVKFGGVPRTQWCLEVSVDIPQGLIKECLQKNLTGQA